MLKKVLSGLLLCLSFIGTANAGSVSGETITGTGCNSSGICFINMSGDPFGPSACQSRQVTFNGRTADGKSFFASALTAKVSESEVRLGFSDSECNGSNPSLTFLTIL